MKNPAPGYPNDNWVPLRACKAVTPLCLHPPVVTQPSRHNGQLHQQVCHRFQAHSEALLNQEGEWRALIMLNYRGFQQTWWFGHPNTLQQRGPGAFLLRLELPCCCQQLLGAFAWNQVNFASAFLLWVVPCASQSPPHPATAVRSWGTAQCLWSNCVPQLLQVPMAAQVQAAAVSQDELKKQAAWKAVDYVKSGMVVGLGTGSTAAFAVDRIGQLMKEGTLKDIVGVPTSIRTYEQAKSLGIPLATLDEQPKIDVAIDGADEVDPNLDVVKGRGGALLREKMVEMASAKFVCIVDDTKLVDGLGGSKLAMPVEIVQFCHKYTLQR